MRMHALVGAVVLMNVICAPVAALAQQAPPSRPQLPEPERFRAPPAPHQNRNYLLPEMFFRASQEARTPEQIARVNRANQLAELVDAGRCDEALAIAREARDRHMSLRVRQLCR